MKEYVKKFPTVASADGHVIDNPFIASVVPTTEGAAPLNIHCAQEGKMLSVSGGSIEIVDAPLTFSIYRNYAGDTLTFQFEEGMTWAQWVASDYNTNGYHVTTGGNIKSGSTNFVCKPDGSYQFVSSEDEIIANATYPQIHE